VRDLPTALTSKNWRVTVLTPAYGMLHLLPGAEKLSTVDVEFRGARETVEVFDVTGSEAGVRNVVFEHPYFSPNGPGQVYCGDEDGKPFATDANKFAFFSASAAAWINAFQEMPDVVHLHDWHAALYAVLKAGSPKFDRLRNIRTVFTIHNLSYQGTRPLRGDTSSLEAWFPDLDYDTAQVRDPAHADCINPMAAAIRLADRISTVSPSYAEEICMPSNSGAGFFGGEGLEGELRAAKQDGRLVGILNGCFYNGPKGRRPGWQRFINLATEQVNAWSTANAGNKTHDIARRRLHSLPKRRPKNVLTSVGRLVPQKASLFFEPAADGRLSLDVILDDLDSRSVLIVLGSGEEWLEQKMLEVAERRSNLLFLCGYSETLADPLYRMGDLFLMPSSFEPCGISQMLAMRAAQPCVVHGVGGLKDTVAHNRSGFVFGGDTPAAQASEFVKTVEHALDTKTNKNVVWQTICIRAASARFSWPKSAQQTIELLYENN
jgi:starch synthase